MMSQKNYYTYSHVSRPGFGEKKKESYKYLFQVTDRRRRFCGWVSMVRGVAALRTDKVKIRSRGRTIRQSRLNNYLAVTLAGYLNTMSKRVCLSVSCLYKYSRQGHVRRLQITLCILYIVHYDYAVFILCILYIVLARRSLTVIELIDFQQSLAACCNCSLQQ